MATSDLNRWFFESHLVQNEFDYLQSMGLSRPRCDLNVDQLASLSNSKCLYLMVINVNLESRETPFKHLLLFQRKSGRKKAYWSKLQTPLHYWKVTLRIYAII